MSQTAELVWLRRDFFALPDRGELAGESFLKERLFEFVEVGQLLRVDGFELFRLLLEVVPISRRLEFVDSVGQTELVLS